MSITWKAPDEIKKAAGQKRDPYRWMTNPSFNTGRSSSESGPEALLLPSEVQKKQRVARSTAAQYIFQRVQSALSYVDKADDVTQGIQVFDVGHVDAETLAEVDVMVREFGWSAVCKPEDAAVYVVPLSHVDAFVKRHRGRTPWDEVKPGAGTAFGMVVAALIGVFGTAGVSFVVALCGLLGFLRSMLVSELHNYKDEAANYKVFSSLWLGAAHILSAGLRYLYINGVFS